MVIILKEKYINTFKWNTKRRGYPLIVISLLPIPAPAKQDMNLDIRKNITEFNKHNHSNYPFNNNVPNKRGFYQVNFFTKCQYTTITHFKYKECNKYNHVCSNLTFPQLLSSTKQCKLCQPTVLFLHMKTTI